MLQSRTQSAYLPHQNALCIDTPKIMRSFKVLWTVGVLWIAFLLLIGCGGSASYESVVQSYKVGGDQQALQTVVDEAFVLSSTQPVLKDSKAAQITSIQDLESLIKTLPEDVSTWQSHLSETILPEVITKINAQLASFIFGFYALSIQKVIASTPYEATNPPTQESKLPDLFNNPSLMHERMTQLFMEGISPEEISKTLQTIWARELDQPGRSWQASNWGSIFSATLEQQPASFHDQLSKLIGILQIEPLLQQMHQTFQAKTAAYLAYGMILHFAQHQASFQSLCKQLSQSYTETMGYKNESETVGIKSIMEDFLKECFAIYLPDPSASKDLSALQRTMTDLLKASDGFFNADPIIHADVKTMVVDRLLSIHTEWATQMSNAFQERMAHFFDQNHGYVTSMIASIFPQLHLQPTTIDFIFQQIATGNAGTLKKSDFLQGLNDRFTQYVRTGALQKSFPYFTEGGIQSFLSYIYHTPSGTKNSTDPGILNEIEQKSAQARRINQTLRWIGIPLTVAGGALIPFSRDNDSLGIVSGALLAGGGLALTLDLTVFTRKDHDAQSIQHAATSIRESLTSTRESINTIPFDQLKTQPYWNSLLSRVGNTTIQVPAPPSSTDQPNAGEPATASVESGASSTASQVGDSIKAAQDLLTICFLRELQLKRVFQIFEASGGSHGDAIRFSSFFSDQPDLNPLGNYLDAISQQSKAFHRSLKGKIGDMNQALDRMERLYTQYKQLHDDFYRLIQAGDNGKVSCELLQDQLKELFELYKVIKSTLGDGKLDTQGKPDVGDTVMTRLEDLKDLLEGLNSNFQSLKVTNKIELGYQKIREGKIALAHQDFQEVVTEYHTHGVIPKTGKAVPYRYFVATLGNSVATLLLDPELSDTTTVDKALSDLKWMMDLPISAETMTFEPGYSIQDLKNDPYFDNPKYFNTANIPERNKEEIIQTLLDSSHQLKMEALWWFTRYYYIHPERLTIPSDELNYILSHLKAFYTDMKNFDPNASAPEVMTHSKMALKGFLRFRYLEDEPDPKTGKFKNQEQKDIVGELRANLIYRYAYFLMKENAAHFKKNHPDNPVSWDYIYTDTINEMIEFPKKIGFDKRFSTFPPFFALTYRENGIHESLPPFRYDWGTLVNTCSLEVSSRLPGEESSGGINYKLSDVVPGLSTSSNDLRIDILTSLLVVARIKQFIQQTGWTDSIRPTLNSFLGLGQADVTGNNFHDLLNDIMVKINSVLSDGYLKIKSEHQRPRYQIERKSKLMWAVAFLKEWHQFLSLLEKQGYAIDPFKAYSQKITNAGVFSLSTSPLDQLKQLAVAINQRFIEDKTLPFESVFEFEHVRLREALVYFNVPSALTDRFWVFP